MSDVSDSETEPEARPPPPAASERTPLLPGPRPARRHSRRRNRSARSLRTASDPGARAVVGVLGPLADEDSGSTTHLIAADITPTAVLPHSGHMSVNFDGNEDTLIDADRDVGALGAASALLDIVTNIGRQRRQDAVA